MNSVPEADINVMGGEIMSFTKRLLQIVTFSWVSVTPRVLSMLQLMILMLLLRLVCTTEWQDDFLPWRIEHLGPVQLSSEPRSYAELSELCSISLLLHSGISSDVISDVLKNGVSFWFALTESMSGYSSVMLATAGK